MQTRERERLNHIMQTRERERLQKMGRSSLQTDSLMQSRKKLRSFSLPRFRRSSSADERQEVVGSEEEMAKSAEDAARVQKAAAWQWYTRGVGEAVLPTKRPPVGKSPPIDDKSVVDGRSKVGGAISNNNNVLHKKYLEPPELAESPRAASRFKAEAQATPSAPSAAPSTPLYDEFELSGLRTQMADFVQRLQLHQQTKQNEQSRPAQKSKSNLLHVAVDGRPLPAAASVSIDHQHTKAAPPPASAAISCDDQLIKPPPTAAPVASTIPFHVRPFSALHRLFRKVVSGSIVKSSTKIDSSPAVYESSTEVVPEEEDQENSKAYHYHHYIHHHHHHYHYGESPDESTAIMSSWRRHSESSGLRPHIPSLLEAESDEKEAEDVERSPIEAYLSRRRRHSDSFAGHLMTPKKATFDEEDQKMKTEEYSAKAASPLQFQRRSNSERFSPNKIPTTDTNEGFNPDIRSRRRHSAEYQREGASPERKAEGGGKSGGRTYKLGGGATDGATAAMVRRRYSEGLQRPEGVHSEMGKRTPSRYVEDVLKPHIGASARANAAPAPRPRPRDLPPIYPQ